MPPFLIRRIAFLAADFTQVDNTLRRPAANKGITEADVEAYKRKQIENAQDERQRRVSETLMEAVSFPDHFPAYRDFVVDADGNLWVGAYRRPGDDQPRWTVFDRTGRMLGEVRTPVRFTIFQIGTDFMLGSWADELDVQRIRMYDLLKD